METKQNESVTNLIDYDDFAKVEIRVGLIQSAEAVPETDKLIKCIIDFGEQGVRTIVSGIRLWREPDTLVGKRALYVSNLKTRVIKGIESQGMLLACIGSDNSFALASPDIAVPAGTKVG